MPFLAYDIDGTPHAGRLTRRALVGRRLSHGVVLTDPGVSRLHAWFDPAPDGTWAVADAGSQAGVTVNGHRVARHDLRDGDVVVAGATRITFHAAGEPPADAEPVTLSPPPGQPVGTDGVLFACPCGAPIWVGNDLAGKRGRCRHCKRQVVVPMPGVEPAADRAAPVPPGRHVQCGVCHSPIASGEPLVTCPECETTYHGECWAANLGCSTYGCGRVDVLNPAPAQKPAAPQPPPVAVEPDEPPPPPMPWEWVTVLAALVASAAGALAFGVPPAAVAVVAGVMVARRRPDTRVGLLVLAIVLAVLGVAAGVLGSQYLYLGRHH